MEALVGRTYKRNHQDALATLVRDAVANLDDGRSLSYARHYLQDYSAAPRGKMLGRVSGWLTAFILGSFLRPWFFGWNAAFHWELVGGQKISAGWW